MGKITSEYSSLRISRKTLSHLTILQDKLKFHSADELISVLVSIAFKKQWTKLEMEFLAEYGRKIEFMSGTAKDETEMKLNLGILTQTTKVKGKLKKKPKEEDKDERKGVND